jgi:hypothetical protein
MDSILVIVKDIPTITVSGDTITCLGNEITLSAQGGDTYEWLDHPSIISKNGNTLLAKPLQNTYYTYRGSKDGCYSPIDSILVNVNASLPILKTADTITCRNNPITVTVFPSTGITLKGDCSLLSSKNDSLIIMPNSSGYIIINGQRAGCASLDSFYVDVKDVPIVTLPKDTIICRGNTIEVQSNGANTYSWSSNGVFTQLNDNRIRIDSISSDMIVKVIGNNGFCESTDEMKISVIDPNIAAFTLQSNGSAKPGERFSMKLSVPSAYANAKLAITYDPSGSMIEQHVTSGITGASHVQTVPGAYQLTIDNSGNKTGEISLSVMPYLPPDDRTFNTYVIQWLDGEIDCTTRDLRGCDVPYEQTCAWTIRPITRKGQYQFMVKNNTINIQSGLNEQLHCIVSTIDGRILHNEHFYLNSGEYKHIPLPNDLPFGTYAITIQGTLWKETILYPHYGENR